MLPSVLIRIVKRYATEMEEAEHHQKLEEIYRVAFGQLERIFCPPTLGATVNGGLIQANVMRFDWTNKILHRMLQKLEKLNEPVKEWMSRFLRVRLPPVGRRIPDGVPEQARERVRRVGHYVRHGL